MCKHPNPYNHISYKCPILKEENSEITENFNTMQYVKAVSVSAGYCNKQYDHDPADLSLKLPAML